MFSRDLGRFRISEIRFVRHCGLIVIDLHRIMMIIRGILHFFII